MLECFLSLPAGITRAADPEPEMVPLDFCRCIKNITKAKITPQKTTELSEGTRMTDRGTILSLKSALTHTHTATATHTQLPERLEGV